MRCANHRAVRSGTFLIPQRLRRTPAGRRPSPDHLVGSGGQTQQGRRDPTGLQGRDLCSPAGGAGSARGDFRRRPPRSSAQRAASEARSSPHPAALFRPCLRPSERVPAMSRPVPPRQNRLQRRLEVTGQNAPGDDGCGEDRASEVTIEAPRATARTHSRAPV